MSADTAQRAHRRTRVNTLLLTAPLLAFIAVTFVAPIISMMTRGVYDPTVHDIMPETVAALSTWDRQGLPPEEVYAAAARELAIAREERTIGQLATRLNRQAAGLRSVITRTGRGLSRGAEPPLVGIASRHP